VRRTHSLSSAEEQVRTQKETENARRTHPLSRAEEQVRSPKKPRERDTHSLSIAKLEISQYTERIERARGTHFLSSAEGGCKSGQLRNTERTRGTHYLSSAEGMVRQDTEKHRVDEGHSLSVERGGRDKSGH